MPQIKQVSIQSMDHLGLVAALLKKYKIAQRIDLMLPIKLDKRTKSTYGQRICALILNGLGFTNATLYMTPDFFKDKPIEALIAPGLCADDMNEDALGRCLDKLNQHGTTRLFSQLAFEIIQEHGLLSTSHHLDSTSLALFGEYNGDWKHAPIPKQGYSKDHRPDLKQVVVNLITNGPAGLPIYYESYDGNAADKTIFHDSIAYMRNFIEELNNSEDMLWVADSALYNTNKLQNANVNWLTRVPATLNIVKQNSAKSDDAFEWCELDNGYRYAKINDEDKDSPNENWVLYSSEQGKARQLKTLEKKIDNAHQALTRALKKVSGTLYACEHDARQALKNTAKKAKYHQVVEREIEAQWGYEKRGRPKPEDKKLKGYRVIADIVENAEAIAQAKHPLGRFVLATNKTSLTPAQMLKEYKQQSQVENGFRFMKDKSFQSNRIYLQNPQRIDALLMVMSLSLLVYNLGQYELRARLTKEDETLPNQLGHPTQSPTLRWVFQMLRGISYVDLGTQGIGVANISEREEKIIRLFGKEALDIYQLS
ncbi:IS1634 family transposase [Saccharobesus litoralis]|nr:IS1634 family transposase [Saccharobesus litoralis]